MWGRAGQAKPAGRGPALFLVRLLAASLVSTLNDAGSSPSPLRRDNRKCLQGSLDGP